MGKNYRYVSNGAREMAYKLTMMVREEKKISKCRGPCWKIPAIGELRK